MHASGWTGNPHVKLVLILAVVSNACGAGFEEASIHSGKSGLVCQLFLNTTEHYLNEQLTWEVFAAGVAFN